MRRRSATAAFLLVSFWLLGLSAGRAGAAMPVEHRAAPATSQTDAVTAFYTALDAQDFPTAYGLLSDRFRAGHPYSSWLAGYATTAAVGVDASPTDDPSTVAVYLTAIDTNPDFTQRVTRYSGVWHLIPDGAGGWLLDTAEISIADEPAAYAAPAADFSDFAEEWEHHGFALSVNADGSGTASWRTYQWCSEDPTPPCDAMVGNQIIDGGHSTFAFDAVFGSSAVGSVTSNSGPNGAEPNGPASLTLLPFDMAVLVQPDSIVVLCGSSMTGSRPQAVQMLCGA